MSQVDDLLERSRHRDARRERPNHPKGWEPGISLSGRGGTVVSEPTPERDPQWDRILQHFEFDPDEFDVLDDTIEVRSWEGFIRTDDGKIEKTTLWYHKARIVRRRDDERRADVDALVAEIKKRRPGKRARPTGDRAMIVAFSDWQIGKLGTTEAVERILEDFDAVLDRARELRRAGRSIGSLYVAQMGDIIENTDGHYAMQTHSVELDKRAQSKVARRLLKKALVMFAPHFERIVVLGVPGNHPENRKDGKAYTTFADNEDLAIVEELAEIFDFNPEAFGHVSFVVPDDQLTVTLDVCGTVVAFAHGHQFPKKKYADQAAWEWWADQAAGMQPAGDATLLLSGHRHHYASAQRGNRTWFQCPTMDSGSEWYRDRTGEETSPGTLTLTVGPDGWDDLKIL